jgi:hypothetical protein
MRLSGERGYFSILGAIPENRVMNHQPRLPYVDCCIS